MVELNASGGNGQEAPSGGSGRPSGRGQRDSAYRGASVVHCEGLAPIVHLVPCSYCEHSFDLFAASWCEHQDDQPSKVCPHCQHCLCAHPAYAMAHFWRESPGVFRDRGFSRLFLFYL